MTKQEGGKGPYSVEPFGEGQRYIKGPFPPGTVLVTVGLEEGTVISKMCNMAYAAGRESRDDLRKALEEASRHSTYGEDDEYGIRCCCKVPDYLPHAKHCELTKALSADEEAGK